MRGNPFYVQPGNDFSQGLQGLGQSALMATQMHRDRQAQEEKAKRFAEVKMATMDAYNSKDPEKMMAVSIQYPEVSQAMKGAMGFYNKQTEDNYRDSLFDLVQNPTRENALELVEARQGLFKENGMGPDQTMETDSFMAQFDADPEAAIANAKANLAFRYPERYKSYASAMGGGVDPYKGLSTGYETYLRAHGLENSPESYEKYNAVQKKSDAVFSPSPLKKMIDERQALIDSGVSPDDSRVRAYDSKLSGDDIDLKDLTPNEVDYWGSIVNLTGKVPSLGRGKQATKIRMAIAKSAARQALGADEDGVPDDPNMTPAEAALETVGSQADTKAIQGSLNFLDKQLSSMGSFVVNLGSQVDKVKELSEDLKTFDTRLLNVPLRTVRGKLAGSPLQAKYDMYLSEIESEIGKLATGSTGSVAELSAGAQEKWSQIHDKNLSVEDMMSLLEETKQAANFRLDSVQGQLDKTRDRMRTREFGQPTDQPMEITTQAEFDKLPQGAIYLEDGVKYRKP